MNFKFSCQIVFTKQHKFVTSRDLKNFKVTITFCTISQFVLQYVKENLSTMLKMLTKNKPA